MFSFSMFLRNNIYSANRTVAENLVRPCDIVFFSTFIYPSSSVDAFARSEEEFLSTTLFIHISASMYDMIMPFYKTIRASLAKKEDILPVVLSPMAMCLTSQNTHGILRNRIERLDVCQA
jgi:hypothetical protein